MESYWVSISFTTVCLSGVNVKSLGLPPKMVHSEKKISKAKFAHYVSSYCS